MTVLHHLQFHSKLLLVLEELETKIFPLPHLSNLLDKPTRAKTDHMLLISVLVHFARCTFKFTMYSILSLSLAEAKVTSFLDAM